MTHVSVALLLGPTSLHRSIRPAVGHGLASALALTAFATGVGCRRFLLHLCLDSGVRGLGRHVVRCVGVIRVVGCDRAGGLAFLFLGIRLRIPRRRRRGRGSQLVKPLFGSLGHIQALRHRELPALQGRRHTKLVQLLDYGRQTGACLVRLRRCDAAPGGTSASILLDFEDSFAGLRTQPEIERGPLPTTHADHHGRPHA
mmetsp:Transcript_56456/g.150403  ORF Transcript_56456/g.150403 Transcript_56456/m.150403 type:complete len:200 (-) Transcript_56456:102-701(-)